MKPPRGIKISKPYRDGDLLVCHITMAKWRFWYEIAKACTRFRARPNVELYFKKAA